MLFPICNYDTNSKKAWTIFTTIWFCMKLMVIPTLHKSIQIKSCDLQLVAECQKNQIDVELIEKLTLWWSLRMGDNRGFGKSTNYWVDLNKSIKLIKAPDFPLI